MSISSGVAIRGGGTYINGSNLNPIDIGNAYLDWTASLNTSNSVGLIMRLKNWYDVAEA